MHIVTLRTTELSVDEKNRICLLFGDIFNKEMSRDRFDKKFLSTLFRHSYHTLLLQQNDIVGSWSFIPYQYSYFGQARLFALSVDTMIKEGHRGNLSNLINMENNANEIMRKDNISFVLHFPNYKVYPVSKTVLSVTDIGMLDYFILPINIGTITKHHVLLNVASRLYADLINIIPRKPTAYSGKIYDTKDFPIEKYIDVSFLNNRYDEDYTLIKLSNLYHFVYKLYRENNIRVAYLIDVYPLKKELVESAVQLIHEKEHSNIDIIMYVGHLPFSPCNLFKVPLKYQPRPIHMCGKILLPGRVRENIFDLNNWNVNLSNYDVR